MQILDYILFQVGITSYPLCKAFYIQLLVDASSFKANKRKKGINGAGILDIYKCKKPCIAARLFGFKIGIDILSRALGQVPSAQVGLTSLFGMGRGDPHRNKRHKGIQND